jgi:threonine/homoserine/homoserine lactone efflux protein
MAYTTLRWAGTVYLLWLGFGLMLRPHRDGLQSDSATVPYVGVRRWFVRGLLSNLMNPKVGVFYVSFLPQFVPPGMAVTPFVAMLAAIHITEGALWFAFLIAATRHMTRWLRRPALASLLNRLTGAVLVAFGLRLAVERR